MADLCSKTAYSMSNLRSCGWPGISQKGPLVGRSLLLTISGRMESL